MNAQQYFEKYGPVLTIEDGLYGWLVVPRLKGGFAFSQGPSGVLWEKDESLRDIHQFVMQAHGLRSRDDAHRMIAWSRQDRMTEVFDPDKNRLVRMTIRQHAMKDIDFTTRFHRSRGATGERMSGLGRRSK